MALLQSIENIGDRKNESKSHLSAWQKWGIWLGTEIEKVDRNIDRLELQKRLTDCLFEFRKEKDCCF